MSIKCPRKTCKYIRRNCFNIEICDAPNWPGDCPGKITVKERIISLLKKCIKR